MLSGKEGDVGACSLGRNRNHGGEDPVPGTPTRSRSGRGRPYDMYIMARVEARAESPTTTKLYYTLVYDNSMMADDAAREKNKVGASRDVYPVPAEHEDAG